MTIMIVRPRCLASLNASSFFVMPSLLPCSSMSRNSFGSDCMFCAGVGASIRVVVKRERAWATRGTGCRRVCLVNAAVAWVAKKERKGVRGVIRESVVENNKKENMTWLKKQGAFDCCDSPLLLRNLISPARQAFFTRLQDLLSTLSTSMSLYSTATVPNSKEGPRSCLLANQ